MTSEYTPTESAVLEGEPINNEALVQLQPERKRKTVASPVHVSRYLAPSTGQTVTGDLILASRRSFSSLGTKWVFFLASVAVAIPAILCALLIHESLIFLIVGWPAYHMIDLLINSYSTRYRIYQNRIDFVTGIVSRRITPLWLFEIVMMEYDCGFWNRILGGAKIRITIAPDRPNHTQGATSEIVIQTLPSQRKDWSDNKFMEELWQELTEAALIKRRSMKKWFV